MFDQTAVFQHLFDDLAQRQSGGLLAQHVDHRHERAQVGTDLARHRAHRVVQRAAGVPRHVLQLLQAARTNAARREIDHPQKAGVVVGVLQQTQVGQRVLDLGAFEETQAAVHPVWHARVEERGFNHPALGIAAVQHRDFLLRNAVLTDQLPHLLHHPLRFGEVAGGLIDAHRLARALVGSQVFAQALAVVADQRVGRIQDVAEAAVVLLQLDLVFHLELAHEIGHVAHPRAPERVDALVIVAHRKHRGGRVAGGRLTLTGDQLDPGVLEPVGVLKLIDQDVAESALVMLADRVVVAQQLVGAQHQLAEVDHAFALALVFIQLVDLDLLSRLGIAGFDHRGAMALFFAARNEILDLLGREALVIDVVLLHQALDGRELVLRVQDLERLRQVGELVVRAKKAVAQAMKGADPHAAHVQRQHGGQPRHHLLCRLVGERDGQDAARRSLAGLQQPGDAGGQYAGLARTRAGQNQRRLGWQRDRAALLRVEVVQQRRIGDGFWKHATIVESPVGAGRQERTR